MAEILLILYFTLWSIDNFTTYSAKLQMACRATLKKNRSVKKLLGLFNLGLESVMLISFQFNFLFGI